MPNTPKRSNSTNHRRGHVENKKSNNNKLLKEKASSFHGRLVMQPPPATEAESRIRRPNTSPDLFSGRVVDVEEHDARLKLTKLLVNVTVQGGVGAVQLIMSPECTVGELIAAAVKLYTKEGRRPFIDADPVKFDLHYSQFSLESLEREENLNELGSRNFYLCTKTNTPSSPVAEHDAGMSKTGSSSSPSCSNEVEKTTKNDGFPWLKFMNLLK